MMKYFSFLICFFVTLLAWNGLPGKVHADEVVVISNTKTPALKMRIVFNEELSIGEIEGDENYMFGSNIGFNTDDEGNFYVMDYESKKILKYDPEGKHLLSFGREGQGPGEFRSLSVPRFDKDNNLYIYDTSGRRISFFDRDGNYLRQITVKERYIDPFVNSKGFIVANKWEMNQQGNVQKQTFSYGLFNDKFELLAELFKDEYESPMPTGTDESSLVNFLAKAWSQAVFRPGVRMLLADNDFIYLGRPEKFEVNVYSPEGRLVKKITRDYDPLPVNDKDKEEYFRRLGEGLSSSPQFNEDMIEQVFQKMKFPKFKPAYQSFTLMDNGWLAVIVESVEGEYTFFDIFDRDGKYIAHFKTPVFDDGMYSSLLFFNNNKAYCVAIEDDYRFVKRYSYEIQEYKNSRWEKIK
jgi:hypothetical protein